VRSHNRQRRGRVVATIVGMTTTDIRPTTDLDEVAELFQALLDRPGDAPTACPGWTAHELLAHLAAGAQEEASLIEAHLAGEPSRPTRAFDERERPFRELADAELRERTVELGARLTVAIDHLRASEVAEAVPFSGRAMTAADFAMHSRSECALHRWDLVGSDEVSRELLGRPALTTHALGVLGSMAVLAEAPTRRATRAGAVPDTRVVLRSEERDDLVVTARDGAVQLALVATGDDPATVLLAPADRLLALWGRRPAVPPTVSAAATDAERHLLGAVFGLGAAG
jgi:uncharacterized protein (TIGR03083 family)